MDTFLRIMLAKHTSILTREHPEAPSIAYCPYNVIVYVYVKEKEIVKTDMDYI